MSSHHFVKEGQEPAAIILGNEWNEELLGTVLEWSPNIIAASIAVEKLLLSEIKIDILWQDTALSPHQHEQLCQYYPCEAEACSTENLEGKLLDFLHSEQGLAYLFGWDNERILSCFEKMDLSDRKWLIALSTDFKWISIPEKPWSKWFSRGAELKCSGQESDWQIIGPVEIYWPHIKVLQDGMIHFQNNRADQLGEKLG